MRLFAVGPGRATEVALRVLGFSLGFVREVAREKVAGETEPEGLAAASSAAKLPRIWLSRVEYQVFWSKDVENLAFLRILPLWLTRAMRVLVPPTSIHKYICINCTVCCVFRQDMIEFS